MTSKQKDKDRKKTSSTPAVETLVSGRTPRATAGNRLGKLLNEETEDDFYKTALGGFEEESGDEEYETEDDAGDIVDSDFDNDEGEDAAAQDGSDFEEPAKKRAKTTYKDPRAKKAADTTSRKRISTPKKATQTTSETKSTSTAVDLTPIKSEKNDQAEGAQSTRKSYRLATVEQRREHEKRQLESQSKPKKAVKVVQFRKLSQEELLAEAVETERENLASLAAYRRLEEERKKSKHPKAKIVGPSIRFISTTLPMLGKVKISDRTISAAVDGATPPTTDATASSGDQTDDTDTWPRKYARNFLSFSDNVATHFDHQPVLKAPTPLICPVTGLPAKYRDPVTGKAYATAEAFHIIRTRYARDQHRLQQRVQEKG
ncbi:vacuolar protein sorting-associated protein 72 homolog [Sycon ciliatum]|uniref:vacuolar protein sorting-associated protein 72 homolog n=1 Tax=Sycon ciliatum TaxID=27933 RepID=UPI0020AD16CB|eukprot:scpid50599/ scgid13665/ Vacuolar protein sorting-associated protein 72 homolog; Transcription factor-like 1